MHGDSAAHDAVTLASATVLEQAEPPAIPVLASSGSVTPFNVNASPVLLLPIDGGDRDVLHSLAEQPGNDDRVNAPTSTTARGGGDLEVLLRHKVGCPCRLRAVASPGAPTADRTFTIERVIGPTIGEPGAVVVSFVKPTSPVEKHKFTLSQLGALGALLKLGKPHPKTLMRSALSTSEASGMQNGEMRHGGLPLLGDGEIMPASADVPAGCPHMILRVGLNDRRGFLRKAGEATFPRLNGLPEARRAGVSAGICRKGVSPNPRRFRSTSREFLSTAQGAQETLRFGVSQMLLPIPQEYAVGKGNRGAGAFAAKPLGRLPRATATDWACWATSIGEAPPNEKSLFASSAGTDVGVVVNPTGQAATGAIVSASRTVGTSSLSVNCASTMAGANKHGSR